MVFSLILQLPSSLSKWTEMSHPSMNKALSCNQNSKKRKNRKKRKRKKSLQLPWLNWDEMFPQLHLSLDICHFLFSQRPSCWVISLSLLFGCGRKQEVSPVRTWILASRMRPKSDKVGKKIIPSKGFLLSGLLVPSTVQFWKANMRNSSIRALQGFIYSFYICWVWPMQQAVWQDWRVDMKLNTTKPLLSRGSQLHESGRYSNRQVTSVLCAL